MNKMFCFQCEQTANSTACTTFGMCGKNPAVAKSQDELTDLLIDLAQNLTIASPKDIDLIVDGLFISITNVNFDEQNIFLFNQKIKQRLATFTPSGNSYNLYKGDKDIVSLRSTLLFGLRGMAAYAYHARVLGIRDVEVDNWFIKGMKSMNQELSIEQWLELLMEFGQINLKCMQILDQANTQTYGNPTPVQVPMTIEKGPFIVVTGHDLKDIKMLLEQTKDKKVNIYTHGEMLPAHGYPELKKYSHLKGNFGTAWQNQQKEFHNIPAPILFTTNCIMPVKENYSDKVYTTSVVAYPNTKHINANADGYKDFSAIIEHAIALGGYQQDQALTGINGGRTVTTGFGRQTVLDNAGTILDAIKAGAIKHFFLVGGCDGAKPGRNYYTNFVKQTPADTIILTLACGKFRINDLNLGNIGAFPRILDMGQCNDAYGAIEVAIALSKALDTPINDLPLTLVLSWYEQKAVCILLTLLSLGLKNIYIGPSIPAFFSENVLNVLIDKFNIKPISTPEQDLKSILAK